MHVARTKGELVDRLGWMILGSPEFKSDVVADCDIERAFDNLAQSIDNTSGIADRGRAALHRMSAEARAFYDNGQDKEGNYRLHDMQIYIRNGGWKDAEQTPP
jgi:hypothetical protein